MTRDFFFNYYFILNLGKSEFIFSYFSLKRIQRYIHSTFRIFHLSVQGGKAPLPLRQDALLLPLLPSSSPICS